MAIKIDYSKCYNNNSNEIGKTNKIDSITINTKDYKINSDAKNQKLERDLIDKEFLRTYVDSREYYSIAKASYYYRSYFYTTLTITLSYSQYPELKNAINIQILDEDIVKTGEKRYSKIYVDRDRNDIPKEDTLAIPDNYFLTFPPTITPIVENKSSEDAKEITYKDVIEEIDKVSFVPDSGSIPKPSYTFKKYDNYMVIELTTISRLQQLYRKFDILGYLGLAQGRIPWIETATEYDFDDIAITIKYEPANVEEESKDAVTYGNGSDNIDFDSMLFVTGNTYNDMDYSYYYANSTIEDFKNGKQILSLTIPVGNYSFGTDAKDMLDIGDECIIVNNVNKKWITLTDDFSFGFNESDKVPNEIAVKGLEEDGNPTFTGRIWKYSDYYTDYDKQFFPIIFKIQDSDKNEHIIFTASDNKILVESRGDNGENLLQNFAGINGGGTIEEYRTYFDPVIKDEYGNAQLYRVLYTNLRYEGGMLLEDIKLEPIVNNEEEESIFEHSGNIITGIKSEYKSKTSILSIPPKIGQDIITEIGDSFAYDNDIIEKVYLPYSITTIGREAFAYTQGIRTPITFPTGLKTIESMAFYSSEINGDLVIPEGVEKIGYNAFGNCSKVDGILSIPNSFKFSSADSPRFKGMTSLSKIIIYSDVFEADRIDDFEDTGTCNIYVPDTVIDIFRAKMPDGFDTNRIKSLAELY